MRKVLLNLLFLSCFSSVESAPNVELNLKASVDPELNIERIDNNGDIDLFSRKESQYCIISNHDGAVVVTINTTNQWKAKKKDVEGEEGIEYRALFKSKDKEEELSSEKNNTKIEKESFIDQKYEFSLIFYAKEPGKKYSDGTYIDTITVNVLAV